MTTEKAIVKTKVIKCPSHEYRVVPPTSEDVQLMFYCIYCLETIID